MTPLGIRWRMTIWNTAAFAAVLAAFGLLVFWLLLQTHYEQVDQGLRRQLAEVGRLVSVDASPDEALAKWVRRVARRPQVVAMAFDPAGGLLAADPRITPAAHAVLADLAAGGRSFSSVELPELGHRRVMVADVPNGSSRPTVVVAVSLEHVDEEMNQVLFALAITIPVTLLIAAVLAYVLARQALRPVDRLRRLTAEISADRLDRRLPVANAKDELGLLAETVNEMIGRLERSFTEIRRFTADASHELRTPVAIIRAETEEELDRTSEAAEHRPLLASILEECQRLARLTDQLLTLSREDARRFGAATTVDLALLARETAAVMRPFAEAKRQTLTVAAGEEVSVYGDVERLRQVLRNLIDNAIKYAAEGGTIRMTAERRSGEAVVSVADDGPGIPPEHLPWVFNRFYRVEKSRSRTNGGAGLGLSIARSIVEAHAGRIEAASTPGAGSVFEIRLPACKESGRPPEPIPRQCDPVSDF